MDPKLKKQIQQWPLLPNGEASPPGRVTHMIVQHDDWCRLLRGKGDCNCNPDITRHVQPKG
jgi:hypothetical protein